MHVHPLHASALALSLLVLSGRSAAQGPPDPATLPLLGDQNIHLYTQEAYEAFPPGIASAVAVRYAELVSAGMDTARHLFDWADLEPAPGVYDTQLVASQMAYRTAFGIRHQFANLTAIDTEGPVVPPHIQALLNAGVPWDDPRITTAFARMLDVFVPILLAHDTYLVGFGNEPGGYYEDSPAQAGSFAGFVQQAVDHVHSLVPELACTVTFAGPTDAALPALMPLVDVASFNQYAYFQELDRGCTLAGTPLPLLRSSLPSAVGALLDGLISVSQGKLICIQEFGQSTGWNDAPRTLGPFAGVINQRDVYHALVGELEARRPWFRTVCNWTLNDYTPAGVQYLGSILVASGFPPCYVENLLESFGPTGLVHSDALASKKPAFDAFARGVTFFAQGSYGCGLNPPGSLAVEATRPGTIGGVVVAAVHNPLGTQSFGATLLAVSAAPAPPFPCGLPIPGTGMRGGGAPGELLVDLSVGHFFVPGPLWLGNPVPIAFPVPNDPQLVGAGLFLQGVIIEPLGRPAVGLTSAARVVLLP